MPGKTNKNQPKQPLLNKASEQTGLFGMMPEPVILNNRYQIEERLGSGGMAMVYRARDLTLERRIAIKILRKNLSADAEFRDRFHQEAKSAANLSHPNIVTVHDFGLFSNQLFIVMEFVPGTDVKTILKRQGRFKISTAINLMEQACAGIGYAHRAGLIHCDIKPQNMLVTPDQRIKVLDFGIARALSTISPDEQTDVVWGSPQYFSPEQAAGAPPSPASDVYSLGVVLFEMLTGHLPFNAATPQELAELHREALPPSPRKYNPSIPVSLEQIILKILSKEPAARYRTADQLGQVLANFNRQPALNPVLSGPIYPQDPIQKEYIPPTIQADQQSSQSILDDPLAYAKTSSQQKISPRHKTLEFDWIMWVLTLIALVAIGGLIPFWLWVFYVLNPPL